ncbi:glycosyltransferase family 2 protein [Clostridium sp. CM028]|uniref:glycosyltransferase family 2 protein n=1 Tax=Clostridium sp. CM028 TaxID=2851575 RepID=UPI001C6E055D|nr:glycosyltransferase family 2 protein [Clostridium sp. CM028]MBW9148508.1 glycosyltransferase family 2 protein [Clostridium sp. CM028]WLC61079.1 glycosyltransferase family 2 protein [Clostridium sp. CM028]
MNSITILLSTYNGEEFLEEQLNSIANQTFAGKIKLLVRDDGSSDSTLSILKKWKCKLSLTIIKGANKGVVKSFSELISIAPESDYYAFCDQDDIWNKDKIESAVNSLEKQKSQLSPLLYFSNALVVDENLKSLNYNVHTKVPGVCLSKVMVCNPSLGCTMVFNRPALDAIREANITKSPMHDKTMLIICILTGNVVYDHTSRMLYRQHRNNVMGRQNGFTKRMKQAFRLWVKADGCSMAGYAEEILKNMCGLIEQDDRKILEDFANYKKDWRCRFKLIFSSSTVTEKRNINRSFKIRVLLGLA